MPLILGRLVRGDDLVIGIEALAQAHGLTHAIIRSGPGSLDHGCVEAGGPPVDIPGPGAELLTLYGEVGPTGANLHGAVGDPDAKIYAGRFVRGRNPICITLEVTLEGF